MGDPHDGQTESSALNGGRDWVSLGLLPNIQSIGPPRLVIMLMKKNIMVSIITNPEREYPEKAHAAHAPPHTRPTCSGVCDEEHHQRKTDCE
jgi:hypothetical protein